MPSPKILLVDDEESLRITLAANLELEGYEVVEANSGEHALEIFATQTFDLVLTDIRMPGINGVDLFRRLKQLRPELPVLLMTAFALEDLVQSALGEGVFTLVPKPFDVGHVVRSLGRAAKLPMVLVVDDVPADSDSTAQALNAIGVKARAVCSGEEALAQVQQGGIDVCVVDLVMPTLDGAQVVERLRQLDPKMAVIAVSGYSVPELIQRASAHRVFTTLKKPFAPAELVQAIARARGEAEAR